MVGDYVSDDIPRVDVLIPTIGRRSLEMAILSACHQTYRSTRVVVIGDGEQKTARQVVRNMRKLYGAIEYWETPTPYGHGDGVRLWWFRQEDCAPWVKCLDDDDILHPCCLATMMAHVAPGVVAVLCKMAGTYQADGIVQRVCTHEPALDVGACGTGQMLVARDAARHCEWPHRADGEVTFMRGMQARGEIRTLRLPLYWYMAYRDNKVRYK